MISYLIFILSLLLIGILMEFEYFFYIFLIIPIFHLFFLQIKNFNKEDPMNCLKIFKSNNLLGSLILANILIGKFF